MLNLKMKDALAAEAIQTTKKGSLSLAFIVVALIVAVVFVLAGYALARNKVTSLEKHQAELSIQISLLQEKTEEQTSVNKGIPVSDPAYKDPDGGLGLLDGSITFTLPKEWERRPADRCSSYSRDATVLCYDTAAIAPKAQSDDAKNPYWKANVSVFEYRGEDGTARQWFENRYYEQTLNDRDYPPPRFIDESPIADSSGLTFQVVAGHAYVDGFYVVVRGAYAIVVSAQLQYGAVYGTYPGAQKYDYRATFDPILKQFINSVRFKDS